YGFQKSEKKFNQEVGSSKQYEKPVEIRTHISGSVLGEIGASKQRLAPTFSCSAWRQYWRLALRLKTWRQALAPELLPTCLSSFLCSIKSSSFARCYFSPSCERHFSNFVRVKSYVFDSLRMVFPMRTFLCI